MKLYAIKWKEVETEDADDSATAKAEEALVWFKSFGCMVSSITEFEGKVIAAIVERNGGGLSGPWYTHPDDTTHAGKTGMALKLWWQRLQEETEARDKNEKAAIHARAIEIARASAKARPESYYSEPFQPHAWVIDAITIALTEGGAA
jgi:hypothetical protein